MVWDRIGIHDVPFLLTAIVFLALAVGLMVLDPGKRLNQSFALFLTARGMLNGLLALQTGDPSDLFLRVAVYFEILLPFATLYFVYVCLREYGRLRTVRWVPPALLLGALVAEGVYLWDPGLRFVDATVGPLALFNGIKYFAYASAALALGVAYLRSPESTRGESLFLLALGFALDPLWIALFWGVQIVAPVGLYSNAPLTTYEWGYGLVGALSLLPVGLLAGFMARRAKRSGDKALRQEARRFLWILTLPMAAAVFTLTILPLNPGLGTRFEIAFHGIWPLVLGVLAIAAITRHQLLGADLQLKWTLSRGTLAAVFVFLFFILSEGAQVILEDRTGSALVGVFGAGLLVFTLVPLQRLGDRLADAAMPGVVPIDEMGPRKRAALYQEWVRLAWSDGSLNKKERRMLDHARERFGLTHEEAARYEKEAVVG